MRRQRRRGGRAQQELTRKVLATYGTQCHLRLPGCTGVATTKDHIIPYAQGGTDALSNFLPACRSCNGKRQDRTFGQLIRVVTGPPASGKSTYVQAHAHPADVVIDLDRIAQALMPDSPESRTSYPQYIRHIAIGARKAAITRATRIREHVGVWIVHALPTPDQLEEYQRYGWQIIRLDPGQAVTMARIEPHDHDEANRYYMHESSRNSESSSSPNPLRSWGI